MIKNFKTEIQFDIQITHYRPGRAAPACSNPDSPEFSDSGDDPELEFIIYFAGTQTEIPEEMEYLYTEMFDEVLMAVEDCQDCYNPFD